MEKHKCEKNTGAKNILVFETESNTWQLRIVYAYNSTISISIIYCPWCGKDLEVHA